MTWQKVVIVPVAVLVAKGADHRVGFGKKNVDVNVPVLIERPLQRRVGWEPEYLLEYVLHSFLVAGTSQS